jgi:hypothetical protein
MAIGNGDAKKFPLIKLAKKLKDSSPRGDGNERNLFPLIKLAKKLKEVIPAFLFVIGCLEFPLIKLAIAVSA